MKYREFKLNGENISENIKITFEDDEFEILNEYYEEIKRISNLESYQKNLEISLTMTASIGEILDYKISLPSEEDIIIVLHSIRPFILNNERLNFYKIINLLKRKIQNYTLVSLFKNTKDLFSGKHFQKKINVTTESLTINSESFLFDYLNAFEYHRDKGKKDFFKKLFKKFPEDFTKFFIISLIKDKTLAIFNLGKIIGFIIGDIKGLKFDTKISS